MEVRKVRRGTSAILGAIGLACWAGVAFGDAGFRVGAASGMVTPPDGTFLAGYDPNRASTGIHDDLWAKAVVFDDGKMQVALLVVDCIGLQYDTVCAIRAAVAALAPGFDVTHLVVQSTHTHCGPDVIGIWGKDLGHCGRDPDYMEELVDTCAAQVARALKRLEPARAVCATTECKGWAVNDCEPEIVDNSVTLLQCVDAEGKSIATLTNFACHPTVLDGDQTLVSADWVGAFYEAMKQALPGEHLFLQGSVGCWIQPETPERTFALAEKYGKDLADKTLAALKTPTPLPDTLLRFARKEFEMPVGPTSLFRVFAKSGIVPRAFGDTVATEVAWFAVGPAQFATHPGESAPEFAEQTRSLMDTGPKFILGLGFDELGYICPTRYFDAPDKFTEGPYLIMMSPGREAGAALMATLETIIP